MTISSQTSRVAYTGNGSTTGFAVPFAFQQDADLIVYVDNILKALTTDYTITSSTVTFLVAPISGAAIVIYRDPPLTQDTDYSDNDPFPASATEDALDKLTMVGQRTREIANRALRLSDGEAALDMTLPPLTERAGLIATYAADGTPSVASAATLNLTVGLRGQVTAASTGNINLAAPGATIDGVTMAATNTFLAKNQTVASANGVYLWNGAAVPATRSTAFDTYAEILGSFIMVEGGTVNIASGWVNTNNSGGTLGVTSITYAKLSTNVIGNQDLTGTLNVQGNFSVNTNKFTVDAATGNAAVTGTLAVTGTINGAAINGTTISGTNLAASAAVTGATVAASAGVTGATVTASGALSGATAVGSMIATQAEMEAASATDKLVTAGRLKFSPGGSKAYGQFPGTTGTGAVTPTSGSTLNVASVNKSATGTWQVTVATAFSSTSYIVTVQPFDTSATIIPMVRSKTTTTFEIRTANTGGTASDCDFVMFDVKGDFA